MSHPSALVQLALLYKIQKFLINMKQALKGNINQQ